MNIMQMRRGMGHSYPLWIEEFCSQHSEISKMTLNSLYNNLPSIRASLDEGFSPSIPYTERSSGYAETFYLPSSNTNVDMTSRTRSYTGNPFWYQNTTTFNNMYACILDSACYQARYGSGRQRINQPITGVKHRLHSNGKVFYVDNTTSVTINVNAFQSTENMKVFHYGDTFVCDMYNLQFSEGGVAKLWLVPYKATNPNTGNVEGCFADICTGRLYFDVTNSGGFTYYEL